MAQRNPHDRRRRQLIQIASMASLTAIAPVHAKTIKTPGATEGPYYPLPSMRFDDIDNDLVKIEGKARQAGGEVITLKGVVTDTDMSPLAGVRVEIWQCDVNGRYLHTGDSSTGLPDTGFQGFGHTITNESGEYSFRTIKPVPYPGRTPHIHVKLFRGDSVLTTQFYLKDNPENLQDRTYQKLSAEEKQRVDMEFTVQDGAVETVVNVIC